LVLWPYDKDSHKHQSPIVPVAAAPNLGVALRGRC